MDLNIENEFDLFLKEVLQSLSKIEFHPMSSLQYSSFAHKAADFHGKADAWVTKAILGMEMGKRTELKARLKLIWEKNTEILIQEKTVADYLD